MTLLELITDAAQQLTDAGVAFGHGTTNAFDEAAWLVLWQLGLPFDSSLADPAEDEASLANQAVAQEKQAQVATLIIARISSRKPAAYLTREAWLQGIPFYVDERVIVPRSLIAEVVVNGDLDYWLSDATQRVLDLCTGNGSLAVLAAMTYPDVSVDGADLSEDALAVAQINVERHQLQDRIKLLHSDGLASVNGPYDLILCNPPYVSAQSMADLPPEYRAEPALALDGNIEGGRDGMDFIRHLLREAPAHMTDKAILVLEIGNEQAHFDAAFPTLSPIWLDTAAGDAQVLLLTREALLAASLSQPSVVPDWRLQTVTTPEQLALFKELLLEYAAKDLDSPTQSTIWQDLEQLPGRYAAPHGAAVLAWSGDELAGCGAIAPTQQPGLVEIKRIYVRQVFRRQGLARALSQHLLGLAQQAGYHAAGISTWPHNTQALALYRELGMTPISPFKTHSHAQLDFLGVSLIPQEAVTPTLPT